MHTILLVDDDRNVRRSVGDMLERSGCGVLRAKDGHAALEALRGHDAVDLVIADHRMPGMDGLTLARRIKEMAPDLPVVIMTGYGDLESYLCASALGVVRYIGKPVGPRELQQILRDVVAEGPSRGTLGQVRDAQAEAAGSPVMPRSTAPAGGTRG